MTYPRFIAVLAAGCCFCYLLIVRWREASKVCWLNEPAILLFGVLLKSECLVTDYLGLLGSFSKLSELIFELAFVDWVPSEECSKFRWLLFSVIRSEFSLF